MRNIYSSRRDSILGTFLLMFVFLLLLAVMGYAVDIILGVDFVFYVAVFVAIIMNIVAYWKSDSIVLSMHKAVGVKRDEYPDLWNVTENLCIASGMKMPRLYVIEDDAMNAFATGRNEEKAVVAVTRGLLNRLNKAELEGVIAHELSHIRNRDILIATIAAVLAGVFMVVVDFVFRYGFFIASDDDSSSWLKGVAFFFVLVLGPLGALLLRMAISRNREYLADSSAVLMTRYPEGLARALAKISKSGIPLKTASVRTSHLFIENPFAGSNFVSRLFSTHPPVEKRIDNLLGEGAHKKFLV